MFWVCWIVILLCGLRLRGHLSITQLDDFLCLCVWVQAWMYLGILGGALFPFHVSQIPDLLMLSSSVVVYNSFIEWGISAYACRQIAAQLSVVLSDGPFRAPPQIMCARKYNLYLDDPHQSLSMYLVKYKWHSSSVLTDIEIALGWNPIKASVGGYGLRTRNETNRQSQFVLADTIARVQRRFLQDNECWTLSELERSNMTSILRMMTEKWTPSTKVELLHRAAKFYFPDLDVMTGLTLIPMAATLSRSVLFPEMFANVHRVLDTDVLCELVCEYVAGPQYFMY
jgi:hypothetical protein